jgi:regulator of sigma D
VNYLYSLYDALVSINVPSEKARAVVDAMERDMGSTLATKQDLQLLSQELDSRFALVDQKLDTLELRLTVKLGSMMVVGFGLTIAALRLWT